MSDLEMGLAAGACVVAAMVALAVPWWVLAAVLILAGLTRHPIVVTLALAMVVSVAGHRAEAGLTDGPVGRIEGWVTLATDPAPGSWGRSAVVSVDGRRLLMRTQTASSGGALRETLAGERLFVVGRARPIERPTDWHRSQHLAGLLDVARIDSVGSAGWVWSTANAVRRILDRGADRLDEDRPLFAGLVIGDDRDQSTLQRNAFRASGLAHLLAVSGQNVAFLLVVAGPLTRRLLLRSRFIVTLGVLAWFALLTRFEPSVLRAVAMAAIAAGAAVSGRPASGRRAIALAVVGLTLIDPLIVWSFGFRLSVAASIGLVVLARPLADRLPFPPGLAAASAVTLAATAGTAPLLVGAFGVVPAVTVLTNLLAVPVAGAVMVWGMTAGIVAGLVPPLAPALHLPTRAMLWWIDTVATIGADPRWPRLSALGVGLVAAVLVAWYVRAGRGARSWPVIVVALALTAAVGLARPPIGITRLANGAELIVTETTTVLSISPGVDSSRLLDAFDGVGAPAPDSVVETRSSPTTRRALALLRARYGPLPVSSGP